MLPRRQTLAYLGAFFSLSLAACAGTAAPPVSSPDLPTAVPPIPTAVPTVVPTVVFTNSNWGATAGDPARYTGSPVTLTGEIFNVETDDTRTAFQMWTDPLRGEGNTVVTYLKKGFPDVQKGDQVEVQGKLIGEFNGKNDSGETLKLPKVAADSVKLLNQATPAPTASGAAAAAAAAAAATAVSGTATPSARASGAPTATPAQIVAGVYKVQGSEPTGLAVRRGPGLTQAKLGVVHDGGFVQVVGPSSPGWAEVKGDGFSGFVSRLYLTGPTPDNPTLSKLTPN